MGLAVDDFHQIRHIVVVVVLPAAFVGVVVRVLPDDPGGPVGGVVVVPLRADQSASRGGGCVLLDPHQCALAVVEVPQLRTGSAAGGVGPQPRNFRFSAGGILRSWEASTDAQEAVVGVVAVVLHGSSIIVDCCHEVRGFSILGLFCKTYFHPVYSQNIAEILRGCVRC